MFFRFVVDVRWEGIVRQKKAAMMYRGGVIESQNEFRFRV